MSLKRRKLHTCFLCEFSKIHFLFVLYCFQELKLEEINTLPLSLPKWLNGDDFFQHDCFDRLKNAPCNAPCFSYKINEKQLMVVFAPKIREPKLFSSSKQHLQSYYFDMPHFPYTVQKTLLTKELTTRICWRDMERCTKRLSIRWIPCLCCKLLKQALTGVFAMQLQVSGLWKIIWEPVERSAFISRLKEAMLKILRFFSSVHLSFYHHFCPFRFTHDMY